MIQGCRERNETPTISNLRKDLTYYFFEKLKSYQKTIQQFQFDFLILK